MFQVYTAFSLSSSSPLLLCELVKVKIPAGLISGPFTPPPPHPHIITCGRHSAHGSISELQTWDRRHKEALWPIQSYAVNLGSTVCVTPSLHTTSQSQRAVKRWRLRLPVQNPPKTQSLWQPMCNYQAALGTVPISPSQPDSCRVCLHLLPLHSHPFYDAVYNLIPNLKSEYKETFLYLVLKLKPSSVLLLSSNLSLFCNNKNAVFHPRAGCMPK